MRDVELGEKEEEEERRKRIPWHPLSLFSKTLGDVQLGSPPHPAPGLCSEQGQECGRLRQRVQGVLEFFCSCASRPREQSRCICARKTICVVTGSLFLGCQS